MKTLLLFYILIILLLSSCTKLPYTSNVEKISINSQHQESLKVVYTGCGGFLIQDNSTKAAILLDPYFSNVSPLLLVPFKNLEPDIALIDQFFKKQIGDYKDRKGNIKAILIAHSHYDHLADVPSIYNRNCKQDSTRIIGSKTTYHILKSIGIETDTISTIHNNIQPESINIPTGKIEILPIPSEHAPHFCGLKLISSKTVSEDLEEFPQKASQLPEGENYNFLIDLLDLDGNIKLRIFSHAGAAACNDEIGLPASDILAEKPVDVLFLCAANYNQVENYPETLLKEIEPRHIVVNHWENFFKPIRKLKANPTKVPATNVKKFLKMLEGYEYTMPVPETEMLFYY